MMVSRYVGWSHLYIKDGCGQVFNVIFEHFRSITVHAIIQEHGFLLHSKHHVNISGGEMFEHIIISTVS